MARIVNPPKQTKPKVYGGGTTLPRSISGDKKIKGTYNSGKRA